MDVKGIGPGIYARIKDKVIVAGQEGVNHGKTP